jgi:hypothetical protein
MENAYIIVTLGIQCFSYLESVFSWAADLKRIMATKISGL